MQLPAPLRAASTGSSPAIVGVPLVDEFSDFQQQKVLDDLGTPAAKHVCQLRHAWELVCRA
jgi:hypothetical protein